MTSGPPDERRAAVAQNRALNVAEVRAGAVRLASGPLQVNVELTGVCNIEPPCVFCSGKNFRHDYAPLPLAHLDKYASVLDRCERVNEDSFGEPLGHPQLPELAERVIARGQRFSLVTNGLLLTPARADRLAACGPRLGMHVSFNAASEETFHQLTGRSFRTVLANVRYFVDAYRRLHGGAAPDVILTFIVMRMNRHEVPAFLRLVQGFGVRALLASLHDRPSVPRGRFGYDFVYEREMLTYPELRAVGDEALALAEALGVRCRLQWDAAHDFAVKGFAEPGVDAPCLVPWRYLFLQEHTGKAFACPYHRVPYGDLATTTLDGIWNGEAAQALRRSLLVGELPKFCLDHSTGCPLVMADAEVRARTIESSVVVGENDYDHLRRGWYPLERVPDAVRWTSGSAEFQLRARGAGRVVVEATTWGPRPVDGWLELDGHHAGAFRVDGSGWQRVEGRLPEGRDGEVVSGRIHVPDTWSPAECGLGSDTRRLGVVVRALWVE